MRGRLGLIAAALVLPRRRRRTGRRPSRRCRADPGDGVVPSLRRRGVPAAPAGAQADGYVEEEYLVSGKANVYTWPAPGPAQVRTADAPYTTRILVRRPRGPRHASGNVVVEMLNPSNLFDLNIGWALVARGVHAPRRHVGRDHGQADRRRRAQDFDPQRYGRLSFANPLPLSDPANCATVAVRQRAERPRTG